MRRYHECSATADAKLSGSKKVLIYKRYSVCGECPVMFSIEAQP
jgi:hypothetical protein